jgi:hypothetical protein
MAFGSSDYAAQDYANAKKLDEMVDVLKTAMSEIRKFTTSIKSNSGTHEMAYIRAEQIDSAIEISLLKVKQIGGL